MKIIFIVLFLMLGSFSFLKKTGPIGTILVSKGSRASGRPKVTPSTKFIEITGVGKTKDKFSLTVKKNSQKTSEESYIRSNRFALYSVFSSGQVKLEKMFDAIEMQTGIGDCLGYSDCSKPWHYFYILIKYEPGIRMIRFQEGARIIEEVNI